MMNYKTFGKRSSLMFGERLEFEILYNAVQAAARTANQCSAMSKDDTALA